MAQQGAVIIDVIADIEKAQADLDNLKVQLEDIDTQEVNLDLNTTQAEQSIAKLQSDIENLQTQTTTNASGLGGMFEGIITRIGGKVTGLGASFTSIFSIAKQGLTDIGLKLTSILGIVGIALFVASAVIDMIKQISSENAEVQQELQEIAMMLEAVIKPIIDAIKQVVLTFLKGVIAIIKTILGWVRDLIKTLTGTDIFAGLETPSEGVVDEATKFEIETAKTQANTKAINKNTGGISKNLKEARKQLAGFDEMNILNDNKSSGGGGGTNLGNLGGLGGDVAKITKPVTGLNTKIDETRECIADLSKISIDTFDAMRIDILKTVTSGGKLTDIQKQHLGYFDAEITRLLSKDKLTLDELKRLGDLTKMYGDLHREGALNNEQEKIYKILTDKTIPNVKDKKKALKELLDAQKKNNEATQTTLTYVNKEGETIEEVGKKYGLNKDQIEKVKTALDNFNTSHDPLFKKEQDLKKALEDVGKEAGLTGIDINNLNDDIKGMESKEVEVSVKKPLGQTITEIGKMIADKIGLKKTVDINVEAPKESILTKLGNTIINTIKKKMPNLTIETTTTTKTTTKKSGNRKGALIKYASGGIINQPGRGVPLAVGGEAGREGVIPLTDSQQMALLGEAIGKYITINANITNTMNGRVISKELQKIQNEQSFASNRW